MIDALPLEDPPGTLPPVIVVTPPGVLVCVIDVLGLLLSPVAITVTDCAPVPGSTDIETDLTGSAVFDAMQVVAPVVIFTIEEPEHTRSAAFGKPTPDPFMAAAPT